MYNEIIAPVRGFRCLYNLKNNKVKKTLFKSPTFFWMVLLVLTGLLFWDLFLTINFSDLSGLMPVTIEVVLLSLIFNRHEYAKIGIIIWAVIFLIAVPGLKLLNNLYQNVVDGIGNIETQYVLNTATLVLVGVLILIYTRKTVKITEKKNVNLG